jgi:cell division protein FtsI (penicillin-binding protein 3)
VSQNAPLHIKLESHQTQVLEKARNRLTLGSVLFAAFAVVLCLRLVDLSLLQGVDERERSGRSHVAQARADVLDRNGDVLATSLRVKSLAVRPPDVMDARKSAKRIAQIVPTLDEAWIYRQLTANGKFRWIKRKLTPSQVRALNAIGDPGLLFLDEYERVYPNGTLAAHVLGYTDVDGRGIAGIESHFDDRLAVADPNRPLMLTIDKRAQFALEDELAKSMVTFNAVGAAGLILDVRTGEIVALASLPSFSPAQPTASPMENRFNRVTLGVYELGSTFKAFTVADALETGAATPMTTFDCRRDLRVGRFTINDTHPKRKFQTVAEIFKYSSNIGTAQLAELTGTAAQQALLKRMGFLEPLRIEMPEAGQPLYPKTNWGRIATMTIGYGHGIAVTPLHLAAGTAALVNGGYLVQPTLERKLDVVDPETTRVISRKTSDEMRAFLRMAVKKGIGGTGGKADVPGYRVGGKTGTAEKPHLGGYSRKALISTFAAAFPMDAPRYVVITSIDEPKGTKETAGYATAGWTAAPAAYNVILRAAPALGVEPSMEKDVDLTHLVGPQAVAQAAKPPRTAM